MKSIPITELYGYFVQSAGVCTDSRSIYDNCMFWALKGPNFNGNEYAVQSIKSGASFAVVDEPDIANGTTIFYVENGLRALQELARFHRDQFDIPVLAITGSNGKTTTKELTALVLSQAYRCHYTKGNLNNHIGVPLTLLAMPLETEVAIIEMGANHQGEIMALCEIAHPTHGLITNIGKAHLEGFGGFEGVKKGKGELFNYLANHNGVAFINKEEEFLSDLSISLKHRRVYFGLFEIGETQWLRIEQLNSESDYLRLRFWSDDNQEIEVQSQLIGAYNLANLATAVCLGLYFKVGATQIKFGVESYLPSSNRSQLLSIPNGQIILDAYNANPSSMEKALLNFQLMPGRDKWIVLGAMKELGASAAEEHMRIASLAKSLELTQGFLIGKEFEIAAREVGLTWFENVEELHSALTADFFSNKLILIKGSRSIHLEKLVEAFIL